MRRRQCLQGSVILQVGEELLQGPKFLQRSGLQRDDPKGLRRDQGGAEVSDRKHGPRDCRNKDPTSAVIPYGGAGTSVPAQACGSPAVYDVRSQTRARSRKPQAARHHEAISMPAAIASQPRRMESAARGERRGTTWAAPAPGMFIRMARSSRPSKRNSQPILRTLRAAVAMYPEVRIRVVRDRRNRSPKFAQSIIRRGPNQCLRRTTRAAACGRGTSASVPRCSRARVLPRFAPSNSPLIPATQAVRNISRAV